ncbi:MAG: hypothetical protein WCP20_01465 [Desulfuromonadales bacterium]
MASKIPLLDVQGVTIQYKTSDKLVTATWKVGFQADRSDRLILLGPSGFLSPHPGQVKEILDVDQDDPGNSFYGGFNELRDTIHRVLFRDVGDYVI